MRNLLSHRILPHADSLETLIFEFFFGSERRIDIIVRLDDSKKAILLSLCHCKPLHFL
jgi:hypothetical protein